jgi:hypothetical protein
MKNYTVLNVEGLTPAETARYINNNTESGKTYIIEPYAQAEKALAYMAHAICRRYPGYNINKQYRRIKDNNRALIADLTPLK